jgi:hypothetical protein
VLPFPDTAAVQRYTTLQEALDYAKTLFALNGQIAIELAGSGTLALSGALAVDLPAGTTLELRAADPARPTLLFDGELAISGDASSAFIVNGLVVAASAAMTPATPAPAALIHLPRFRPDGSANLLGTLTLTDCTLVPGWSAAADGTPKFAGTPALIAESQTVAVVANRAILGAVYASPLATVSLTDSILDATGRSVVAYAGLDGKSGGGALSMNGCTVVGKVHAVLLALVSDSIFWSELTVADTWVSSLVADRKQQGCVRFSFLPVDPVVPRRFECVEAALASPQPLFFATRYGAPAYLKLLVSTDDSIRRGADDGGEMGAYHAVLAPQRESDLQIRLREYMPVGLEFGLIYQS